MSSRKDNINNQKSLFLNNIGQIVTANEDGVQSIKDTSVLIENGQVVSIGDGYSNHAIDCGGKMVTSGFADSHTHPVYYNKRDEEYAMRLAGASYEEITEKVVELYLVWKVLDVHLKKA